MGDGYVDYETSDIRVCSAIDDTDAALGTSHWHGLTEGEVKLMNFAQDMGDLARREHTLLDNAQSAPSTSAGLDAVLDRPCASCSVIQSRARSDENRS